MNKSFTRIVFGVFLMLNVPVLKAQQDPHYTQFMFNKLNFNAGTAGATDGKICATIIQRNQWMGFGGGEYDAGNGKMVSRGSAPVNLVGSINAAIGSRIGVGATFSNDMIGFKRTIIPRFTLAYRHPLGDGATLSAGVGAGLMQVSVDGDYNAIDQDDPNIPNAVETGTAPDFDLGLYYAKDNLLGVIDGFYAGFSATHINQSKIELVSFTENSAMHMYFVTGGSYQLNSMMKLQPNVLIKKDPSKIQADLNCFLVWNENIRGGLTWRPMDAAAVLIGYEFPFGLNAGISYDITTSKIIKYSSGSVEFMLRYCFGVKIPPREKVIRSRYTPRFM
jgi:type IX secretion system PorP/SprF family membrane protein